MCSQNIGRDERIREAQSDHVLLRETSSMEPNLKVISEGYLSGLGFFSKTWSGLITVLKCMKCSYEIETYYFSPFYGKLNEIK